MNLNDASIRPGTRFYRIDDLTVDVGLRRVCRAGLELAVTDLSFDLLLALLRAAPLPVSLNGLMEDVWKDVVVSPETVAQRVKLLRQGLGDDADHPRYIATLRGRGYRLVAAASVLDAPLATDVGVPENATHLTLRQPRLAAGVALAGIVAAAAVFLALRSPRHPPRPTQDLPLASVAVLPFANLTGDAGKDYLADGMAEELITTLGRASGVRVPARSSSFVYKGKELDARRIGEDLRVGSVIEGSIRSAGDRIRIDVQLIDTRDGFQTWSESYDREFTDLLQLQDDIALAAGAALRVKLSSTGVAHRTTNIDAYNLFLQGSFLLQNPNTDQSLRAIDLLTQAVQRDPNFARAFGVLADAHFNAYMAWQPAAQLNAAESAAKQALAIDVDTAQAHDVLAAISLLRGHWLEMEAHDRAMLAAEGDAISLFHRSYHLGAAGKLQAATDAARRAYALAPANASVLGALAASEANQGRDDESLVLADRAVALGLTRSSPWLLNIYAQAARRSGHAADAEQLLAQAFPSPAVTLTPSNRTLGLERCMVSVRADALRGNLDAAFSRANRCLDEQPAEETVPGAAVHRALTGVWLPDLQIFRHDARFQRFADRLGLMEYWRQYGPPDNCLLQRDRLECR